MLLVFLWTPAMAQEERTGSALERAIAREVIASGSLLEGDPRLEEVVAVLATRSHALMAGADGITASWVQAQLPDLLPDLHNPMAAAALKAASHEVTSGLTRTAGDLFEQSVQRSASTGPATWVRETATRAALEGARAAAGASHLAALNRLELEYSLAEGGLDTFSVLTVQPLYESADLRHNLFAQASWLNRESRDTLNTGLAFRYVTPDLQHLFGLNAFFDHQWPRHHNRMSLGLEFKTSLTGLHFNHYRGLSDWRGREDGYEEKALGGTDLTLSGRLPQAPELEVFARGFHWDQEKTPVLNPDGDSVWGYELAAEYTPVNAFTVRAAAIRDTDTDEVSGALTLRLNYRFGEGFESLWRKPVYNLDSVLERRFDKVRRENDIRVQLRQDPDLTARVIFAQGASVYFGQLLAFGTTITTGGGAGDAATVRFGTGARLDLGQNTRVRIEHDRIVLEAGLIQYTGADGGITLLAVPGGTIQLIGTDVDLRVTGPRVTLRVRDGAADFTDDTGTTRVNAEQLAEAMDGDGTAPVLRAEGSAIYETHTREAHSQLDLAGPVPDNPKAAPFAIAPVTVTGTLSVGETLSFTVPVSAPVSVTGSPLLRFTLGGAERLATFASGSGTDSLVFTYTLTGTDGGLATVTAEVIEKNGGTLIGNNGAPMVRTITGGLSGSIPDAIPDAFAFADQANVALNTLTNSNIITISGIDSPAAVSVSGDGSPEVSINGGAWGTSGTIENGQSLQVRLTSANALDTLRSAIVTVGGVSDQWDVRTLDDPCANAPSPGQVCADGSVYAGLSPDGGVPMYTTPADAGQITWNNGTSNWIDTAMSNTSYTTGEANTTLLVGLSDGASPYKAAQYCYCLGKPQTGTCSSDPTSGASGYGHDDWYLPARDELDVLYDNLVDQNGDNTPGGPLGSTFGFNVTGSFPAGRYWSSSELSNNGARYQRFSDGYQNISSSLYSKVSGLSVRCVRR